MEAAAIYHYLETQCFYPLPEYVMAPSPEGRLELVIVYSREWLTERTD